MGYKCTGELEYKANLHSSWVLDSAVIHIVTAGEDHPEPSDRGGGLTGEKKPHIVVKGLT